MSEQEKKDIALMLSEEEQYEYCIQQWEAIEADYKLYCDSCEGTPLSLDNWTHCHINEVSI